VELSGKQREETVADCAIPTGWELVGIPAGDVQANHLVAIGVDSGLADMLVAGEEQHARWCVVRHVPHDPSKGSEQTTAEASCSDSDFVISEPVHSGANKVTFTVRRGADGRPVLVDIKTQ